MAIIERFEDILGWQAARELKAAFSKMVSGSRTFTKPHLRDQMERAVDSSMTNIAEGFESGSDPEFIRFLRIAKRSAGEFQSHLYAARDAGQISKDCFDSLYELAAKTKSLIGGFIGYLEECVDSKSHQRHRGRRKKDEEQGPPASPPPAGGAPTGDGGPTGDR